jgi:hypothetical protein
MPRTRQGCRKRPTSDSPGRVRRPARVRRTDAVNVDERGGPTRSTGLSERQELRPVSAGCAHKHRQPRQPERDVRVSASEGAACVDDHAAGDGQ